MDKRIKLLKDSHELLKLLMDDVDLSLKEKTHDLSRSINPFKTITDEQEQDRKEFGRYKMSKLEF